MVPYAHRLALHGGHLSLQHGSTKASVGGGGKVEKANPIDARDGWYMVLIAAQNHEWHAWPDGFSAG